MPDEARLAGALLAGFVVAWLLAPVAIRVAARTGFLDCPTGYKAHAAPTPYLGGATVMAGFLAGALVFGQGLPRFWPIVVCTLGLAVLGTIDDRVTVRPRTRVLAELAAAGALTATGFGWDFLSNDLEEFLLTALWIVGFTNAFNLMDNLDGAAGALGAVCAAGIAALSVVLADPGMGAFALALTGACLGFLRFNLPARGDARVFLGDGGSMPLGFLLAALAINVPRDGDMGWPLLLGSGLLLALVVLDTLLVVISRTRRGVSLATGGRDHLTHRLLTRLGSPRAVALALVGAQAAASALAVFTLTYGRTAVIAAAVTCLALGVVIVSVLERPGWAVARSERRAQPVHAPDYDPESRPEPVSIRD